MKTRLILMTLLAGAILASLSQAGDEKDKATEKTLKASGLSGMFGQEQVEVISWRDLAQLLPRELNGMETGKIEGGTVKMGGTSTVSVTDSLRESMQMTGLGSSYSTAERSYTSTSEDGKRKRLTIRLMDAGIMRAMLSPFLMAVEYDTPDGIMKSLDIAGLPAKMMLRYNDDLEVTQTQYMVLVGDRVLAQFEGNEYVDPDQVTAQAENFPYEKLARMVTASAEKSLSE